MLWEERRLTAGRAGEYWLQIPLVGPQPGEDFAPDLAILLDRLWIGPAFPGRAKITSIVATVHVNNGDSALILLLTTEPSSGPEPDEPIDGPSMERQLTAALEAVAAPWH
jgi:hypothetical protein